MKKMFGAAVLAGATVVGVGAAQAEVSANVSLTTDYIFRGISLSGEDPAVQGGFDYDSGSFYAGVWGSSLGSAGSSMEMDLYAGFKPHLGPIALDIGVIAYLYPGADDDAAEFDFYEFALSGEYEIAPQWTVGAGVNVSPDMFGETGDAVFYNVNAAFAPSDAWSISGSFGQQSIDDVNGPLPGQPDDDYSTWNLGTTHAMHGFELDLRYHEADISDSDPIALAGFSSEAGAEGRVVLTLTRTL